MPAALPVCSYCLSETTCRGAGASKGHSNGGCESSAAYTNIISVESQKPDRPSSRSCLHGARKNRNRVPKDMICIGRFQEGFDLAFCSSDPKILFEDNVQLLCRVPASRACATICPHPVVALGAIPHVQLGFPMRSGNHSRIGRCSNIDDQEPDNRGRPRLGIAPEPTWAKFTNCFGFRRKNSNES